MTERLDGPVIAIGMFDGVHRGHRALLAAAAEVAARGEVALHALTFEPHPQELFAGAGPGMLCSVAQRVELLEAAGAERVHVQPFTHEFAALTPAQFVERVLRDQLHAAAVVVGSNFRFGSKAAGDVAALHELGAANGMAVHPQTLTAADGQPVSSTRIRALIAEGNVTDASALLQRPYELDGPVVRGAQRGRELGMRTANLEVDARRCIPADGVYGGIAEVDAGEHGSFHIAAISVGTNPQFTPGEGAPRTVEAHLLDLDAGDILYDLPLRLEFHARVRGQATFSSIGELVERMHADVAEIRAASLPLGTS
jgi:riboflavin kinase/FMN adenylyltransferase